LELYENKKIISSNGRKAKNKTGPFQSALIHIIN